MDGLSNIAVGGEPKRWIAVIAYQEPDGQVRDSIVYLEELGELQGIVEHGPDWNTIVSLKVRLRRGTNIDPDHTGAYQQ